jgi:hypothetical protein
VSLKSFAVKGVNERKLKSQESLFTGRKMRYNSITCVAAGTFVIKQAFKGRKSIRKTAVYLIRIASEHKSGPWPKRRKPRKIKENS